MSQCTFHRKRVLCAASLSVDARSILSAEALESQGRREFQRRMLGQALLVHHPGMPIRVSVGRHCIEGTAEVLGFKQAICELEHSLDLTVAEISATALVMLARSLQQQVNGRGAVSAIAGTYYSQDILAPTSEPRT